MKTILLILITFLFSLNLHAQTQVSCQLDHNLDHIEDVRVETEPAKDKVLLFDNYLAKAYLKEKSAGKFEIEAYIPELQMRIYSQGSLAKADDVLILSLWSRELLIDISCHLYLK